MDWKQQFYSIFNIVGPTQTVEETQKEKTAERAHEWEVGRSESKVCIKKSKQPGARREETRRGRSVTLSRCILAAAG